MIRPALLRSPGRHRTSVLCTTLLLVAFAAAAAAQDLPELTQPVNDFAHVVDEAHAQSMDRTIRALQSATGDVIVVATVPTFAPYGSLEQYANKLFENHGKGIGEKGKDNGLLITVAVKDKRAWIEVGYGLEQYITDGFAGETTRLYMFPEFRQNNFGAGLEAGLQRIAGRIAQARGVTLDGVPAPQPPRRPHGSGGASVPVILIVVVIFVVASIISNIRGGGGGPRRWGRGPWSGWNSGIGPFGGGWGGFGGGFGGFGGGGFGGGGGGGGGGGFGGFGGGSSGGGGGGGGW